jgi:hypothetical protein
MEIPASNAGIKTQLKAILAKRFFILSNLDISSKKFVWQSWNRVLEGH